MATLITRKQYMQDSAKLHRAYYAQFITQPVRDRVAALDLGTLQHDFAIDDNGGFACDKIYQLDTWDRIGGGSVRLMMEAGECERVPTRSALVCIAKEAARIRIESASN